MAKQRILILGAGLAGLSAGWHLQRLGIGCQTFEKEAEVGGLCRSKRINGFTFDCDGHLLHFKHKSTLGLIKELENGNLVGHQRNSWVYSSGAYTRYPFQANLFGLPSAVARECLLGFIHALITPSPQRGEGKAEGVSFNGKSFEEWIFFGNDTYFYYLHEGTVSDYSACYTKYETADLHYFCI